MYNLSIVAMFKNESSIIKQWIKHYIDEKVDYFYLIDNGSNDNYYDEIKEYNKCDLHELNLGYAITIHKAQGSEIPIIIQIISNSHYIMLQRNLLYTGITRAKQANIILGQKRAMYIGIQNNKIIHRNTQLWKRLQEKDYIYDESLIDDDDERI